MEGSQSASRGAVERRGRGDEAAWEGRSDDEKSKTNPVAKTNNGLREILRMWFMEALLSNIRPRETHR
jgi:hypothetical protein